MGQSAKSSQGEKEDKVVPRKVVFSLVGNCKDV